MFDEWCNFSACETRETLNLFNWKNEEGGENSPAELRTRFKSYCDSAIPESFEAGGIFGLFCSPTGCSFHDRMSGKIQPSSFEMSRLCKATKLRHRTEEMEALGFSPDILDRIDDAIMDAVDSNGFHAIDIDLESEESVAQLEEAERAFQAQISDLLPTADVVTESPSPEALTAEAPDATTLSTPIPLPDADRVAWLTKKEDLVSEMNGRDDGSAADRAYTLGSTYFFDLNAALGIDWNILPTEPTFEPYILYHAKISDAHKGWVRQPHMFSGGSDHMFVSRKPSMDDGVISGRTVRLQDHRCCKSVDDMLTCGKCGSPGLPEVIAPVSALASAQLVFDRFFVPMPAMKELFTVPPPTVVEAKNPY